MLAAWGLRLAPAPDNRFHPDEALYGFWGLRILYGGDPWLLDVPVYKPPLLPYLSAAVQTLWIPDQPFTAGEFLLRFPSVAAGIVSVALVTRLGRKLYRKPLIGLLAAVALASSPFAILFSATVFPDPLMVALGLAGCVAAAHHRWGRAGIWVGLAFAAKQTGLVWVPFAIGAGLCDPDSPPTRALWKGGLCFGLGFAATAGTVFLWDLGRVLQGGASFWSTAIHEYGGLRLIWPHELWPRFRAWMGLASYLFASPVINGALICGAIPLVWWDLRHAKPRHSFADILLVSFCLAYVLGHWVWAFPVWDRYLLPLAPILSILAGHLMERFVHLVATLESRIWSTFRRSTERYHVVAALCLLVTLMAKPAWRAAQGDYPVGGDHGAYDGIDQVAAFLRKQPAGSVVYHHWLGWHYAYYLFGAPLYLAYWPTPAWLAEDVHVFGEREPRFIAFPSWENPARVREALVTVGYRLQLAFVASNRRGEPAFQVYQIVPIEPHRATANSLN